MAKSRHGQRRGGSLRRDVAVRTPKRTFSVPCEGEKTEPAYRKALKRESAVRDVASVDIRVDEETSGSVPLPPQQPVLGDVPIPGRDRR